MTNRQVILARRPVGVPKASHFEMAETAVPSPGAGQMLVKLSHWSVDPAMRGWANDAPNYLPPVPLGAPMRAFGVGEVVASRLEGYAEGDVVEGMFGWQDYAVSDGSEVNRKVTETDLPRSYALGILGLNGMTAYFGLTETCAARPGDTLVVSTAAGSVGSAVGQIGKLLGCRTVGIAGGAAKVRQCLDEFGFDAAIDYKAQDVAAAVGEAAPEGVDCYFDNTSGAISDAVMTRLARGARICICGTAAITEWSPLPMGPRVHRQLLVARARMTGLIVFDYADRYGEARAALAGWLRDGRLRVREHVLQGPEAAMGAIEMLYSGANTGKLIVEV
ncbi:MAG: NADP-dependent oxidoreductase [Pseudooceanicola sp.]|nr:NADP-dependent oxidoreductase [Pseudooceanicola sp.]